MIFLSSEFNVVGHRLFANFLFVPGNFDDKRSTDYVSNRSCNFHMCRNRHCQLPEVASVFLFTSFIEFFSVENVWSCHVEISLLCSIHFDELTVFYRERHEVLSWVVVVLFCQ